MKLTRREFILLAIIVYFTFIGGTFYSQFNLWLRVANQIIVTAILGGWLVIRLKRGEGLPRTTLDAVLGLVVLVNIISALLGQSARYSLEVFWLSLAHLLAFYLIVDLFRRGWLASLIWAVYMASAVVCLMGLAEYLAWYVGTPLFSGFSLGWLEIGGWQNPIPPYIYRLNITLNGSTPLASYLAVLITVAVGIILSLPRRNPNRQTLIVWLFLAVPVEILTFSRAGILALAVSLLLLTGGAFWVSGKRWGDVRSRWAGLGGGIRVAVILGAVALLIMGLVWLQTSFTNRQQSTSFRVVLWQTATEVFQEQWLTGAGPGNFSRALLRLNRAELPRAQIATAHSIYFNTAAELGLLGLLVGAVLYFMVAKSWLAHWRQLTTPAQQIRLIAVGATLVGLAAQLLVDTYSATPNVLGIVGLLAYVAMPVPESAQKSFSRWPAFAAIAALLLYALGLGRIALADLHFGRSFSAERVDNLSEAIAQAEAAYRLDPALTLRLFWLASLQARYAAQTGNPEIAEQAIKHYRDGLTQEPIWGLNSANLAGLLAERGNLDEAVVWQQRTLSAENSELHRLNLGYFYEQQQKWSAATETYGNILRQSPTWAGSGFWQATAKRAAQWPKIEAIAVEAETTADETARRLNLVRMGGVTSALSNTSESVQLLSGQNKYNATLIEWYLDNNQPAKAAELLNPTPQTPQEKIWWGRVKSQTGQFEAAEKLFKTAIFQRQYPAYYYLGQLYEQQGNIEAAEDAYNRAFLLISPENIEATIYGRFGGNDLIPQLTRIYDREQLKPLLALFNLYNAQQETEKAEQTLELLQKLEPY